MTATTKALATRRWADRQKETNRNGFRARRRTIRARWQAENREKHNAHNVVYRAVKAGKLIRPAACQRCGLACKPEASHDDYSAPLAVEWLCRECHARKDAAPRLSLGQSACKRGHQFVEENTYVAPDGSRQCRTCNRDRDAARRPRHRKD